MEFVLWVGMSMGVSIGGVEAAGNGAKGALAQLSRSWGNLDLKPGVPGVTAERCADARYPRPLTAN